MSKKIEWEFVGDRAYTPLSYSMNAFVSARKYIRRYLDVSEFGTTGVLIYPNDLYWVRGIREEVIEFQINRHKIEGNQFLWRMADVCEKRGEKVIVDLKEKINRDSVAQLEAKELESLIAWTIEQSRDFAAFITIPWVIESYLNEVITKVVSRVLPPDDVQKIIAELLVPVKMNASAKETPEIWRLAAMINSDVALKNVFESSLDLEKDIQKSYPNFLKEIDDFISNYGWIHVRWFKGTPLVRSTVLQRLKNTIKENPSQKILEQEENRKRIELIANDFAKKYSLTEEERDTIFLVKEYVYIRTYRTDILGQIFYMMQILLERAAQILNLSIDDMPYHSEMEIRKKLLGEKINVDVETRKESWAGVSIDDSYEIFTGNKEIEDAKKKYVASRDFAGVSEVKGISAFKGVVKGKVKIVLDPNDIPKVEKGDVLVAVMTYPSYIVAMEKAAAFVTDEGGILCHASIIAREMKKPCVISTKMGTKVFKDGDMVEVDADNGIVKKIN